MRCYVGDSYTQPKQHGELSSHPETHYSVMM
ncbi:unnamed protein product [Spirodela intermedia]|uniref:Uncharacterized protein n=1 Tax=Spirodela intermedia TaxID=51605 RepID=A0ABN7E9X8_SPIIN|nr:unnamed protein product [Spirodela intermedia]